MPLYVVLLCLNIHSYIGVPWHYWMVCLVGERAVVHGKFVCCPLCFSFTGITEVHHWVLPPSPPPPPALSPLPASLLMAICCRDNHRGGQLTIWRADPCFDRRSISADTHRHGHMQEHTLWQGSTDPDALWHVHTHVGTHTHKRYLSTLLCHVTAQPRWASLSCAMSTGYNAPRLVHLFLQLCAHWLQISVVCLCGNVQVSSFWNVQ